MRPMYERRGWNAAILAGSAAALVLCWFRKLCETIISGQQAESEQMKVSLQKGG